MAGARGIGRVSASGFRPKSSVTTRAVCHEMKNRNYVYYFLLLCIRSFVRRRQVGGEVSNLGRRPASKRSAPRLPCLCLERACNHNRMPTGLHKATGNRVVRFTTVRDYIKPRLTFRQAKFGRVGFDSGQIIVCLFFWCGTIYISLFSACTCDDSFVCPL